VKAVQLGKEGKAKEAAKLLTEHAIGDKELPVKLASVQLLLSQDERKEAIAILENLNERDRSLPGIVSALVTLYMADNDREGASAALKNAVAHYKRNKVRIHSRAHFLAELRQERSSFRKRRKIWENCGDKPPTFIYVPEKSRSQPISCKNWSTLRRPTPRPWLNW